MAILGEPVTSTSAEFDEPACGDLPGDTTTTGRLVVDGDGVKGQHASARDADWYAVSLDAGVDYQFDVVDAPPVYLLKIHNDQGTELRTSAIAPAGGPPNWYQHPNRVNSLPFRTDQAGAYYVSIASPKGGHAPDRVYTLSARSDDHPADTTTTAVAELGELTRVYLMRTSSDPDDTATDDVDWVRASLLANVRYHISFDVGKCPQTAVIEVIHDADGTAIPMTSSSKACSASMYFTPPTKGDYYIAVTGKGSQFVDKDDVDDDGRLKGTYHDRYPFTGADAVLVVSLVVNYCAGESLDTLRDALTPLSEPPGADLPAGTSASGRAPIGSSVTGNIESATDRDWFRVRFNGRIGERVYWLELKGADTGDGTLPDPLIVGIYDRQGNYIPFSHVLRGALSPEKRVPVADAACGLPGLAHLLQVFPAMERATRPGEVFHSGAGLKKNRLTRPGEAMVGKNGPASVSWTPRASRTPTAPRTRAMTRARRCLESSATSPWTLRGCPMRFT